MSVQPSPSDVPQTPRQAKTQAKSRYLKRKKERRRARKSAAAAANARDSKSHEQHESIAHVRDITQPEEDSKSSGSDAESDINDAEANVVKPPRKKIRKADVEPVVIAEEEEEMLENEPSPSEPEVEEELLSKRSQTPVAAFPSFPAPVAPDAPSKAELALQGVDKALLDAEIIDPKHTIPLDSLCEASSSQTQNMPIVSERMKKRLHELEIVELFAVQTALLPFLLPPQRRKRSLYCPYDPPQDVCVSAPTGSGKTLAYAVPVVEVLSARIAVHLRALIVLPTRDLVLQVQETFEAIGKGRGLKIGVATGQHSFSHEQGQLVDEREKDIEGGTSKVDILICTPGRLIDHLNETPGFTLQHLRFLVIDEADRLLAQSFQDWLAQVLAALRPPSKTVEESFADITLCPLQTSGFPCRAALSPLCLPNIPTDYDDPKQSSCQKLLFSATLTRDPARIAALGLRDPKYFVVQNLTTTAEGIGSLGVEEFTMPAGLKEHYVTTSTAGKPLIFFHLIHSRSISNALVFTKSASSTARLVKLFEYLEEAHCVSHPKSRKTTIQAYSSDLSPGERRIILEKFKKQEIEILICSDLVARGLDVPHVEHVISYDAPVDLRKYVHRAGRTARAGREGNAWTLVEEQEARYFKDMLRSVSQATFDRVSRIRVRDTELKEFEESYKIALGKLRDFYSRSAS